MIVHDLIYVRKETNNSIKFYHYTSKQYSESGINSEQHIKYSKNKNLNNVILLSLTVEPRLLHFRQLSI